MIEKKKIKVIRAKSAGFCWGVERAIDIARECTQNSEKLVYTDGPLIHNRQMIEKLDKEGIKEVGDYQSKTELNLPDKEKSTATLVVRAHGISPQRREYLKSLNMNFKDATCPDVGIIAGKIRMHAKKGYSTIIFGDPKHPETIGLLGYTEGKGHAIQSEADIDNLPPELGDKVCMVSQSTMFTHEFEALSKKAKLKYPDLLIFDTICGATKERQSDVRLLAKQGAEAIVVIGGKHSANTRKLVKLSEEQNLPAFHVETLADLNLGAMARYKKIGVTAGASTPDFLIDEVCATLSEIESIA